MNDTFKELAEAILAVERQVGRLKSLADVERLALELNHEMHKTAVRAQVIEAENIRLRAQLAGEKAACTLPPPMLPSIEDEAARVAREVGA